MSEVNFVEKYYQILENLFLKHQKRIDHQKVGVLVSGGIDSSIVAYFTTKFFDEAVFFILHSKDAVDLVYAKLLNQKLDQELISVNFDKEKVNTVRKKVEDILEKAKVPSSLTHLSIATCFFSS
ncbi:MAG: asparagine synthase-related protein [Patescibacteria group bacterium]|nr:asparagine synthase-related protein [Patescibacteria group bacterium]